MSTNPTTPQEELAYIRRIIDESRSSFSEDGKPFIIWGLIVALGMLGSYTESVIQPHIQFSGWLWIGLSLIGVAYILTYKLRNKNVERARNLGDRLQASLWGSVGSTIGIVLPLIFISYSNNPEQSIHPIFGCSISSFFLAIAYYMSGSILEIKWLRNIAFAWWAGAVVMYLMYSAEVLLVYALMLIVFQVVPGIILYRKYRETIRQESLSTRMA